MGTEKVTIDEVVEVEFCVAATRVDLNLKLINQICQVFSFKPQPIHCGPLPQTNRMRISNTESFCPKRK